MDFIAIGDRVREARTTRKLTQDDLAQLASVHRNTIINIETAARESISLKTLGAVAAALEVELDDLLSARPNHQPNHS